jgi:hypothetical protein
MTFTNEQWAIVIVVLGLGGWFVIHKAAKTVEKVAKAVNPANPNNVFNASADHMYQAATGSQGTLGTDAAGFVAAHPSVQAAVNAAGRVFDPIGSAIGDVSDWLGGSSL